jgi:sugar lactone lactonase YvrE
MTDHAELFIDCRNQLGEGPFWHRLRNELFWFDILGQKLFSAGADGAIRRTWNLPEITTAAAVLDIDTLAIATETGLKRFSLTDGTVLDVLAPIEADDHSTRTNDSRVDRTGGFWIGTMRKEEDDAVGAVYHYKHGKLSVLRPNVKIPNSTCFSPDGRTAYFADTPTKQILKVETDPGTGVPVGEWTLFADVSDHRGFPDGSVVDAEGFLWNARWGGNCVVRHAPDGSVDRVVELPVSQVTCPAFGGPDLSTLYITSARKTLTPEQLAEQPHAGSVFVFEPGVKGLEETILKA